MQLRELPSGPCQRHVSLPVRSMQGQAGVLTSRSSTTSAALSSSPSSLGPSSPPASAALRLPSCPARAIAGGSISPASCRLMRSSSAITCGAPDQAPHASLAPDAWQAPICTVLLATEADSKASQSTLQHCGEALPHLLAALDGVVLDEADFRAKPHVDGGRYVFTHIPARTNRTAMTSCQTFSTSPSNADAACCSHAPLAIGTDR